MGIAKDGRGNGWWAGSCAPLRDLICDRRGAARRGDGSAVAVATATAIAMRLRCDLRCAGRERGAQRKRGLQEEAKGRSKGGGSDERKCRVGTIEQRGMVSGGWWWWWFGSEWQEKTAAVEKEKKKSGRAGKRLVWGD